MSGNVCRQPAIGLNLDVLGANANANGSGRDAIAGVAWQRLVADDQSLLTAGIDQASANPVDPADKRRHKRRPRLSINLFRCANLLQSAAVEHSDAVT